MGNFLFFVFWVFPKIVVPQDGWFIRETPIRIDDLGGFPPIFGSTPIFEFVRYETKFTSLLDWDVLRRYLGLMDYFTPI